MIKDAQDSEVWEARRVSFGAAATDYDRFRPGYPPQLFSDIRIRCALDRSSHLLEIGAGTGIATRELAKLGCRVTAVEPNESMLALAREKFASQDRVAFIHAKFENLPGNSRYDCIVAAQSFHWVDPAVRYERVHAHLHPHGWLCAFWSFHEFPQEGLQSGLDEIYARHFQDGDVQKVQRLSIAEETHCQVEELQQSGIFRSVEVRTYPWSKILSRDHFVSLIGTNSDILVLSETPRQAMLRDLGLMIDRYGGQVEIQYHTTVFLCQKA